MRRALLAIVALVVLTGAGDNGFLDGPIYGVTTTTRGCTPVECPECDPDPVAITYVQGRSNQANASSVAVNFTAPPTTGNLLVLCVTRNLFAAGVVNGGLSGWTAGPELASGSDWRLSTYWKISDGSEQNVTVTHSTSGWTAIGRVEYAGVAVTDTLRGFAIANAGATTALSSGNSNNAAVAGDLVVGCVGKNDTSFTAGNAGGAAATGRVLAPAVALTYGTDGGSVGALEDNLNASAGVTAATFTASGNFGTTAVLVFAADAEECEPCEEVDCSSPPPTPEAEDCDVVGDEDTDGLADCLDPDCSADPDCIGPTPEDCDSVGDEDEDGDPDCLDSDCADDPDCAPTPPEDCNLVGDEDEDGDADCEDSDCVDDPDCDEGGGGAGGSPGGDFLPEALVTTWNPGILDFCAASETVFDDLTGELTVDGTGTGNAAVINAAIVDAGTAYVASCTPGPCVQQVILLPAGVIRTTAVISLNRTGVTLRGQGQFAELGAGGTVLRLDVASSTPVIHVGEATNTNYDSDRGPWDLTSDGVKGTNTITVLNADGADIVVGDILVIDEEDAGDAPVFVYRGDANFEKRQTAADTHGPALQGAGQWRSVTSMVLVVDKDVGATDTTLTLYDPLHINFRISHDAQVFRGSTETSLPGATDADGVHCANTEDMTITGGRSGNWRTNNVAYALVKNVESDGDDDMVYTGSYSNSGGMTGRSINLFHCYRCEVRESYIHHARSIVQGGGAYLLSLSSYTSETLIEDNIVVHGNKGIVLNMAGGGNVIGYNYADNAYITGSGGWQEGACNGNHQAFPHHALFEGNWVSNLGSDTTHGNSGWHVFFRNYSRGENSSPTPYLPGGDSGHMQAAYSDALNHVQTFAANVLDIGTNGNPQTLQVDHTEAGQLSNPCIWRIGWCEDGDCGDDDNGEALANLKRHGNYEEFTDTLEWDPTNDNHDIPDSYYHSSKPGFFGSETWPPFDPEGSTFADRVKVLPAKARYDAL